MYIKLTLKPQSSELFLYDLASILINVTCVLIWYMQTIIQEFDFGK